MKKLLITIFFVLPGCFLFSQNSKDSISDNANRIKPFVIGEIAKNVDMKNGMIMLKGLNLHDKTVNMSIDITEFLSQAALPKNSSTIMPISKIKNNIFLVFKNLIMEIVPYVNDASSVKSGAFAHDGSVIFTNEGTMYLSNNGSIVATTPTTLLLITPANNVSITYKELFGKNFPDIENDGQLGKLKIFIDAEGYINIKGANLYDKKSGKPCLLKINSTNVYDHSIKVEGLKKKH